jgi:hypothetical protein
MASKIRDDGGCLEMMVDVDTATQGFLGRNQEGIRLQIFRFFRGWVWGEG